MKARFARLAGQRTIVPAGLILLGYGLLVGIPQYGQYQQLKQDVARQRSVVERLEHQLVTRQRLVADAGEPVSMISLDRASDQAVVSQRAGGHVNRPTRVQSFANVLAVFRSHGVRCTGVLPDEGMANQSAQRITLVGGFENVLGSLSQLESQATDMVCVYLQMQHPDQGPRQERGSVWNAEFQLIEVR